MLKATSTAWDQPQPSWVGLRHNPLSSTQGERTSFSSPSRKRAQSLRQAASHALCILFLQSGRQRPSDLFLCVWGCDSLHKHFSIPQGEGSRTGRDPRGGKGSQMLPHLLTGRVSSLRVLATPLGTDTEWKNTQPSSSVSASSMWAAWGKSGHMASESASVKQTRALTQGSSKHPCPQHKPLLPHRSPISSIHFQISIY